MCRVLNILFQYEKIIKKYKEKRVMAKYYNKKILIMANNDDGLYRFRGMLIKNLVDQGNEVIVSLPKGKNIPKLIELGCQIIETPIDRRGINPKTDFKLFFNYCNILKKIKPDMVIAYTIKPNIYGGLACRLRKVSYALNITGLGTAFQKKGVLKSLIVFLYRLAAKKSKVIFFENFENMKTFQTLQIAKQSKYKLLNGAGVDVEHFSYLEYPKDEQVHFLFIGRIMKEKGVDELFEAMKNLYSEEKNCVLDVLGYFEEDYGIKIEKYEKEGWLKYHGYQSDIRPFVERAHCFVLPSWHEGMANTNLESAASGRTIITSDIPGCKEAVIESKSGYLCERKNSCSLYNSMNKFLKLSYEQRINMGKMGRNYMIKKFNKKKVVDETIKSLFS
ncbi:TPA: glycosyltransferase family 4 protein [Enterococcus faecium]|nr:glycosyltransferase family 4 protein [Enterococcus faecium]